MYFIRFGAHQAVGIGVDADDVKRFRCLPKGANEIESWRPAGTGNENALHDAIPARVIRLRLAQREASGRTCGLMIRTFPPPRVYGFEVRIGLKTGLRCV